MKKNNYFSLIFILMPLLAMSQWVTQSTGFTTPSWGIQHIWAVDENVVWATAYDGSGNDSIIQEFTRTTDGGMLWTPGIVNGATGLEPSMVCALNADTAWIAFHHPTLSGGKIMRTNNGGQSWTHQSTAVFSDTAEGYPNLVYFWDENIGFCMGDPTYDYFEIYTTTNGGNLWNRVDSASMPPLIGGEWGYAAYFSVIGNHIWFGTNRSRLFHSTDKGYHWTAIDIPPLALVNGRARIVEFKDTLNGIVADRVSNHYVLYATSDGGLNWQQITTTGNVYGEDLTYIKGTPGTFISTGAASGVSGASISYDDGLSWTDISGVAGTQYTALGFPNNTTGWAGQFNTSSTVGGIAKFTGSTVNITDCPGSAEVFLYPNPTKGEVHFYNLNNSHDNFIFLSDISGKTVLSGAIITNNTIDLSQCRQGIYFLRIISEGEVIFRDKIVLTD